MSDKCNKCNSLINGNPTNIPLPENTDCPEDLGCELVLPAHCVSVTNVTDCITNGQNLQELIDNIRDYVCNNSGQNNCQVKVNSNDSCCQFLEDKVIAGNGIIINTETNGDCEYLEISEACFSFNNITFKNSWRNLNAGFQTAQYSDIKECSVKLRGVITKIDFSRCVNEIAFTLPSGFRPTSTRVFSVNFFNFNQAACALLVSGLVVVNTNGDVTIVSETINGQGWCVSLDGIEFELS